MVPYRVSRIPTWRQLGQIAQASHMRCDPVGRIAPSVFADDAPPARGALGRTRRSRPDALL